MKFKPYAAGLLAACDAAGYLRGSVKKWLADLRVTELTVPDPVLPLNGAKNRKDLGDRRDEAVAEITKRQKLLADLQKVITDWDRKYPQKKVVSWFVHASAKNYREHLEKYKSYIDWIFEVRTKALEEKEKEKHGMK